MANYVQIELGGVNRGWKVNQMTIELWSKMINEDAFTSSSNYAAVYAGLVANCTVKRVEEDFTFEQVCDWVDELNLTEAGKATMVLIKTAFEESQYYITLLEGLELELNTLKKATEEVPKKKVKKK